MQELHHFVFHSCATAGVVLFAVDVDRVANIYTALTGTRRNEALKKIKPLLADHNQLIAILDDGTMVTTAEAVKPPPIRTPLGAC